MTKPMRSKSVVDLLGEPEFGQEGRDRLVRAALEMFYMHGFHAVGIDRVLAEAGVTKTTFYKHFDSKDDLMVAAVRARDVWESQAWDRAVRERVGDDPRAMLLGYFDVLDEWFNAPDYHGCIFINTAAEFPNPNDPVHQAAAEHKLRTRDSFRDLARDAGLRDPEAFADHYTALFEGTLVLRQVHGRNDAARVMRGAVEALLAAG